MEQKNGTAARLPKTGGMVAAFRKYREKVGNRISTWCGYFMARALGVGIGRGCIFSGLTRLNVEPGGEMTIGSGNVFLSRHTDNHMGLNHRCILTVTPRGAATCSLTIGDRCGFSGVAIWCFSRITIGSNVRVGANSLIMDGDAHFDDPRTSPPLPVTIEDNVFIGANVVVKKGVTIGRNSVVGMNSVVTRSIPPDSVAVGNPAKVIRHL